VFLGVQIDDDRQGKCLENTCGFHITRARHLNKDWLSRVVDPDFLALTKLARLQAGFVRTPGSFIFATKDRYHSCF